MKPILGNVSSFAPGNGRLQMLSVDQIRSCKGHDVHTYSELISKLAQLAFNNPDFVLLMRGQSREHMEDLKTTLFPTIYRAPIQGNEFYSYQLKQRYDLLGKSENRLYQVLHNTEYWDRVGRSDLARWAILQHYNVCPTPLLDVTQSALVACSFAFLGNQTANVNHFFLYVLGVPQLNGSITVSPNHSLQVVRLSSVCPPETLRPYFQEGYLIGNYPNVDTLDDKMRYDRSEMDCAQRLIAKFKISKSVAFWDNGFHKLPESAVYPEETGRLCGELSRMAQSVEPPIQQPRIQNTSRTKKHPSHPARRKFANKLPL